MRAGRGQRAGRAGESQGGKRATERHKWSCMESVARPTGRSGERE